MKKLLIILTFVGFNSVIAQSSIQEVLANVIKENNKSSFDPLDFPASYKNYLFGSRTLKDIRIKNKYDSKFQKGTLYRHDSNQLFLNTSLIQKREIVTVGVITGTVLIVPYLLVLKATPLEEKYKVLSRVNYSDISKIQVKKTNNRNAMIVSGILALAVLSQANKPEMQGSAWGFIGLPLSFTPFLLKPYFSYSWKTIFSAD